VEEGVKEAVVASAGGEHDLSLGEVEDAEHSGVWWLRWRALAAPAPAQWRLRRKIRRPRRCGGSSVVVAHRWRALPCCIFLLFFLCLSCMSEEHGKHLTLCRASPEQAHGKASGRRRKRSLSHPIF
jgi:hypothetical protein